VGLVTVTQDRCSYIASGLCCSYGVQCSNVQHLYRVAYDPSATPQTPDVPTHYVVNEVPQMYRHIMLWTRYRSVCVCHPVSGKLALITHSRQARPFFLAPCHIWHPYLLITILASNFSLYFVYNISPFFLCCENEAITSCCRWPQHILTSYRKCKKVHQNIT